MWPENAGSKEILFFLFHLLSVSWFILFHPFPIPVELHLTTPRVWHRQWSRMPTWPRICSRCSMAQPSNDRLLHHQLTIVLIGSSAFFAFCCWWWVSWTKITRDMCRWLLCLVLDEAKDGCYVGRMPSILQLKHWRSTTLRVSNKLVSGPEGYLVWQVERKCQWVVFSLKSTSFAR